MTITEQAAEIAKLPQPIRLARYLKLLAENAEIGARLRLSKGDEGWTEAENKEWEESCDKMEPYWYSLNEEDKKAFRMIHLITAGICRGENL